MQAELLAVGSELLVPGRSETNGATITRRLLELGCKVLARTTIADDALALTEDCGLYGAISRRCPHNSLSGRHSRIGFASPCVWFDGVHRGYTDFSFGAQPAELSH